MSVRSSWTDSSGSSGGRYCSGPVTSVSCCAMGDDAPVTLPTAHTVGVSRTSAIPVMPSVIVFVDGSAGGANWLTHCLPFQWDRMLIGGPAPGVADTHSPSAPSPAMLVTGPSGNTEAGSAGISSQLPLTRVTISGVCWNEGACHPAAYSLPSMLRIRLSTPSALTGTGGADQAVPSQCAV